MPASTITVDDMRDKLLTVDQLTERLSATEPLSEISVPTDGTGKVTVAINEGWMHAASTGSPEDLADVTIKVGSVDYQPTVGAFLELTSMMGIPKNYVLKTPSKLMEPHIKYWLQNMGKDLKILAREHTGLAFTKASIRPFSNLRLLDECRQAVTKKHGADAEILVDYKLRHGLKGTDYRLVLPSTQRQIRGRDGDNWSVGINVSNDLTGASPLNLAGYMFRWWCTNGAISTTNASGNYSRKAGQGPEVYEWARASIDEILGGFDHDFDQLDAAANDPIQGSVNNYVSSVFDRYRVPSAARANILEALVESDDLTTYGVMQAITQAANHIEMDPAIASRLMTIGGDVGHAHTCESCHRIVD